MRMVEAKAREGLKLSSMWCLYWPEIIIPFTNIAPNQPPANFAGNYIWFALINFDQHFSFSLVFSILI